MTINDLINEYKKIAQFFNERWPLKNRQHKIFTRTIKIVEELGELADEILTSMNLQRQSKIAKFSHQNIENEFADVLASLILLSIELKINVPELMKKKIDFTKKRFKIEKLK